MVSGDSGLKSFVVPASVTSIAENAFQNTTNMTSVTFATPSSITTIGRNAFSKSGITQIDIPKTVTTIESQAFDNCSSLKTVNIPSSVRTIETGSFNKCESITKFTVDASNTTFAALDGMLCLKDKNTLVTFPAGKADSKYTLIPNFTTVAPYAFYGTQKVSNITFPASITSIGNRAIALCTNLKSLSFMGATNVPPLSSDVMYASSNTRDVTIFVRKTWYENSANTATIDKYNTLFKEVHPSFVSSSGYDRGTEFFPTFTTNVGVIGFYTPRTSVIVSSIANEDNADAARGKTWKNTYAVSTILDYAYQGETTVKDIVILADIGVIGIDAFRAGNQLKGIYFVGDTPASLNSTDYDLDATDYPFNESQNIYVKESKVLSYQNSWEVNNHRLSITYKIPQSTRNNGGTVCYPFDVKYPSGLDASDIKPYIPVDYTHAFDSSNPFVRAYSLDDYYVPAYVGAFIRSKNTASVTSYCQMDEDQAHNMATVTSLGYNSANYRMVGAVEDTSIRNESGISLYAFSSSQGKLVLLSDNATFPYFKAYLCMPSVQAGNAKAFSIMYGDSEVTGVNSVFTQQDSSNDSDYYSLDGTKVGHPAQKGIYIYKGKKITIK